MYILLQRWEEPCPGNTTYTLDLTEQEAERLQSVLDWIEEHAGQNYGDTLCEWGLDARPGITGEADYTGIDAVLSMLALESRYNELPEDPGSYYGGRHPDLDGR